jgi:hypothetical protein
MKLKFQSADESRRGKKRDRNLLARIVPATHTSL